jgi:lactate dehydrogenase-like 2-hydroxyacid dehydrogenase
MIKNFSIKPLQPSCKARRIVEAEKYVEADAWQSWGPYLLSGKDVFNSTIGILPYHIFQ